MSYTLVIEIFDALPDQVVAAFKRLGDRVTRHGDSDDIRLILDGIEPYAEVLGQGPERRGLDFHTTARTEWPAELMEPFVARMRAALDAEGLIYHGELSDDDSDREFESSSFASFMERRSALFAAHEKT